MSDQWDRKYRFVFKNLETGQVFTFTDLRIVFDIEKYVDQKEKTDRGSVQVYNLASQTFQAMKCKNGYVWLDVGYGSEVKRLVEGDVIGVYTTKQGTDSVTEFEFAEGFRDTSIKKLTPTTLPEGITNRAVVLHVANELGLSTAGWSGDWLDVINTYGYPIYGNGKLVLDNICKANDLEWKIIDNSLYITDRYGLIQKKGEQAFVLSKTTGMIDIPYVYQQHISMEVDQVLDAEDEKVIPKQLKLKKDGTPRKSSKKNVQRYGVRVKALINPDVKVNSLIKIVSDEFVSKNTLYRVRSVKYNGDNRGPQWWMDLYLDSVNGEEMQ